MKRIRVNATTRLASGVRFVFPVPLTVCERGDLFRVLQIGLIPPRQTPDLMLGSDFAEAA